MCRLASPTAERNATAFEPDPHKTTRPPDWAIARTVDAHWAVTRLTAFSKEPTLPIRSSPSEASDTAVVEVDGRASIVRYWSWYSEESRRTSKPESWKTCTRDLGEKYEQCS